MKKTLALLSILAIALPAFADHHEGHAKDETAAANDWAKYSTPGQHHAFFKDLVGKWKAESKFWMSAGTAPSTSKGSNTNKLIMDGRFLQSEMKATAMGKPFHGMGTLGYDSLNEQYQSSWIDNMGTSITVAKGTFDAKTKTLTNTGTIADPMTGQKDKWFRDEWKLVSKNEYTYSMFLKDADGKEFKNLEITYKRM